MNNEWSKEQRFWNGRDIETYDFYRCDQDYEGDSEMVMQYLPSIGDWVSSVKYRQDVQELENRLKETESLLAETVRGRIETYLVKHGVRISNDDE